jgi:glutathione S-transferase
MMAVILEIKRSDSVGGGNMSQPVLHQFRFSHFNEKARWGLAWKGIRHVRKTYLPGPHRAAIERLSGQTATPVLCLDGEVVAGSARILETLERRTPEPGLFPRQHDLRNRALEIQETFDREVGPAVRTALFTVIIEEPAYLCRQFSHRKAAPVRILYRAVFPMAKKLIARAHETDDPAAVERAIARTHEALDFVAGETAASGFLAGDRFTVADLCCASLLAPLASVSHPDMARVPPVPASLSRFLRRFEEHPALRWVSAMYDRYRSPAAPAPVTGAATGEAVARRGGVIAK